MKNKDRHATQRWERSQERQRVRNEDAYAAMANENSHVDLQLERFLKEDDERRRREQIHNTVMEMNVLKAILLSKKRRGEFKGVKKVIVIP